MIYQFGKNLITKQKHIHLSKVAELLKMKLGNAVLGKLYRKGCWVFFPSLMISRCQRRSPSSRPNSATPASILTLNVQQRVLEFMSLHRWQTPAWTYKPFVTSKISLPPEPVCMLLTVELYAGWEHGEAPARRLLHPAVSSSLHCYPGTGG